jgi:hypothetical protein
VIRCGAGALAAGLALAACGGATAADPAAPAARVVAADPAPIVTTTASVPPSTTEAAPPAAPASSTPSTADPWDVEPVAPAYAPTPAVLRAPEPQWLVVPAIGVEVALIPLGVADDGSMEVPTDADDAGWYVGGPRPGETGPAVIAGHVDSLTGSAVFSRLGELVVGDEVAVLRADGSQAVFTVTGVVQVPKDAFPTDVVFGPTTGEELRLVTCGGAFDRASGHYRDNVVVTTRLARLA